MPHGVGLEVIVKDARAGGIHATRGTFLVNFITVTNGTQF